MTTAFTPDEPVAHREQITAQIGLMNDLMHIDGLTVRGLNHLRTWLRSNDVQQHCQSGPIAEFRAVTLDAICTKIANGNTGSLAYYRGCGDLLPTVPDVPHDELGSFDR